MSYNPVNANGQATMANSSPVVLASDQSSIPVAGEIAAAAADSGKPVKVGGKYNATLPTLTDGQRGDVQLDVKSIAMMNNAYKLDSTNDSVSALLTTQTDTVMIGGVNVKEINAVTPLMGNGTTGTGSLRVTIASDTTANSNPWLVSGSVASAATDSGNPVKMGGKYNTTQPTFTDGQRGDVQISARGSLFATTYSLNAGAPVTFITDNADAIAVAATQDKQPVISRGTVFNGTSWDRQPGTTKGSYALIQDAAGNARGANVTASNELLTRTDSSTTQTAGTYTAMTVTNLQSLASSATAGWQSARVDNQSSVKALDYEIFVKLTTANTAPANDKTAYVYLCPMITTDGGTTWLASDQGTATLPTGSEATTTIATPNNLKPLGALAYTTQQMVMQGSFLLSNAYGKSMPDGFSIIIINFTGAALSTACVVAYRALAIATA